MELNGKEYQIAKLDAMTQLHVSRRLAPLLASMAGEGDMMTKVLSAVGKLSDDDTEYVINKCLTGCTRSRDGGGVAKIYKDGKLLFDDIKLKDMMQLTMATLEENLSDFFTIPSSISAQAAE